jgi:hypothetical protein
MSVDAALSEKVDLEKTIQLAMARAATGGQSPSDDGADSEGEENSSVLPFERLSPLPTPGDPYKAYARQSNRPLPSLSLLKADGTVWTYPYACRVEGPHLVPADDAAKNWVVVLKFAGLAGIQVMLYGRRLEQLTMHLSYQRTAWVREQPKGKLLPESTEPVVTGITIKEVER